MTKRILKSKVFYLIISLFASICLWVYVVGVVNYLDKNEVRNIPVTFVGGEDMLENYSLVISDGEDSTVSLTLYGKRGDLAKVSKSDITIRVDLSGVKKAGEVALPYEVILPDAVSGDEVSVINRDTYYVYLTVQKLETKTIEVRGTLGEGDEVAEGYVAEPFIFDPETVEIMGTEDKLATVKYALVTVNRTDISKTITDDYTYQLISYEEEVVDDDDITLLTEKVTATLPIAKTKEVPLMVEVISGGGATSANLVQTIDPTTITISGDAETVDGVSQIIVGTIDLATITAAQTFEFPITVPNDAKNISGVETATVTVRLSGLGTKTIDATQIELINAPEQYTAASLTQSVTVVVRAAEDQIDSITANNVRLVANLTDYSGTGRYEVPVKVYIDGYSDAGVMGDYKVVVSITEPETEGAAEASGESVTVGSTEGAASANGTVVVGNSEGY